MGPIAATLDDEKSLFRTTESMFSRRESYLRRSAEIGEAFRASGRLGYTVIDLEDTGGATISGKATIKTVVGSGCVNFAYLNLSENHRPIQDSHTYSYHEGFLIDYTKAKVAGPIDRRG